MSSVIREILLRVMDILREKAAHSETVKLVKESARAHLRLISARLQEAQHLLEAVGVAAHVRERCWLHQQRHLAPRVLLERRHLIRSSFRQVGVDSTAPHHQGQRGVHGGGHERWPGRDSLNAAAEAAQRANTLCCMPVDPRRRWSSLLHAA